MKINCIKTLNGCGVFRDFSWSQEDLNEFKAKNLIYGWNGTGKTTLSKIFHALGEATEEGLEGEIVVTIDDMDVTRQEFVNEKRPIRVFNREFIKRSVFPSGDGEVSPIYVLGEDNVEKQKRIDELKEKRPTEECYKTIKKQEKAEYLDSFKRNEARNIKGKLQSSGYGFYNNYDTNNFRTRAEQMILEDDREAHLLNNNKREELLKLTKEKCTEIN